MLIYIYLHFVGECLWKSVTFGNRFFYHLDPPKWNSSPQASSPHPWAISVAKELGFWLPRCQSAKLSYFCISKLGFIKECMLMNNIISTQFAILSDAICGLITQQRTEMIYVLFGGKNIRLCWSIHLHWSVPLG